MIPCKVTVVGQRGFQYLRFPDQCFPRIGEFVTLSEKHYQITKVIHVFQKFENLPGALENEKYFIDIPGLEVELRPAKRL